MKKVISRAVLCALLGLLPVGCSGSGSADVLLTAENAEAVASTGVGAVGTLMQLQGIAEGFPEFFEPDAAIIPCDSGNVDIVINDTGPAGFSTGDTGTVTFNACQLFGDLFTMNGRVTLTADEVTGEEPGPFSVQLTCDFAAFSLSIGGATIVVNGDLTVSLSSADGITNVASVSGTYLNVYAIGGGQSNSATIAEYFLENTLNTETGAYSLDWNATVSGGQIVGTVTFNTTVPFSGSDIEVDPDTGEMVVTGYLGSTLTLVAVDSVNVQLQVDSDGDGTPEVIINTTWDEL